VGISALLREHLQEFAKINLAKLVIWQLAKIYVKLKRRLFSKSLLFWTWQNERKAHKNTAFAVGPLDPFGRLQMDPWPEFRGGADMAGRNPAARGPGGEGGQGEGLHGG